MPNIDSIQLKTKELLAFNFWLPWQLSYYSNEVVGIDSIQLNTKELLKFHPGCHGN